MTSNVAPASRVFLMMMLAPLLVAAAAGPTGPAPLQRRIVAPSITLVSPKRGEVLRPGDVVTVAWETDAGSGESIIGCEQEVFLSLDKGKTIAARLTPELSANQTSFQWTVPNLPSKKAVLVINFGCESDQTSFETANPQKHAMFRIARATAGFQEVTVEAALHNSGQSGSEVGITWQSTVQEVESYEVLASYDRGAHFSSLGETTASRFIWTPEAGFSGLVTFKVIAHKVGGGRIESITSMNPLALGRGQL